jgi:hypothetical protein
MNKTTFPSHIAGNPSNPSNQRLALAVILQAVEDARNPSIDPTTKLEATEFLEGQRSEAWYKLAGLDSRTLQSVTGVCARRRAS